MTDIIVLGKPRRDTPADKTLVLNDMIDQLFCLLTLPATCVLVKGADRHWRGPKPLVEMSTCDMLTVVEPTVWIHMLVDHLSEGVYCILLDHQVAQATSTTIYPQCGDRNSRAEKE